LFPYIGHYGSYTSSFVKPEADFRVELEVIA
jgi:hypothetical protein